MSEQKTTAELMNEPATKGEILALTQNIDLCFTIMDRIIRDVVNNDEEEIEKSLRLLADIRKFIRKNTLALKGELKFPPDGSDNDENEPEGY